MEGSRLFRPAFDVLQHHFILLFKQVTGSLQTGGRGHRFHFLMGEKEKYIVEEHVCGQNFCSRFCKQFTTLRAQLETMLSCITDCITIVTRCLPSYGDKASWTSDLLIFHSAIKLILRFLFFGIIL